MRSYDCQFRNFARLRKLFRQVRRTRSALVVTPELRLDNYGRLVREGVLSRQSTNVVNQEKYWQQARINVVLLNLLAQECHNMLALVGFMRPGHFPTVYNSAALLAEGQIVGFYDKRMLVTESKYMPDLDESRLFTPGRRFLDLSIGRKKLTVAICNDLWHPDKTMLRHYQRSDYILAPNASIIDPKRRIAVLTELATETNATIVYSNAIGENCSGQSMVVTSSGKIKSPA